MVNHSRSSSKIKDEASKKRQGTGMESNCSGSPASNTYGLRKSTRESSCKKPLIPSSQANRKSENLEQQTPPTPISKRLKRERMPSPLRRSERCKKLRNAADSSASKELDGSSASSDMKGEKEKEKEEDNGEKLRVTNEEASGSDKEPVSAEKTMRMSSRAYRALFRQQGKRDKTSEIMHLSQNSNSMKHANGSEDTGNLDLPTNDDIPFHPSHKVVVDTNDHMKRVDNCSSPEKMSELKDLSRNEMSMEVGPQCITEKERDAAGVTFDALANSTCKDGNYIQKDQMNLRSKSGKPEASVSLEHGRKYCNDAQEVHISVDIHIEGGHSSCFICNHGGKLLCCAGAGCKKSYHLSCLQPPLKDAPLGVWHCLACVRKMMKYGAYSVSEGIESIWNVREMEVSGTNGQQMQKQYFVKYKGLAHIHNQWLPEAEVAVQCPSLIANFLQDKQVVQWKSQWTLPRRLLQKQLIYSPQFISECDGEEGVDASMCRYQWLVKWHGLDYENATWELENASLFVSPEVQNLVKEYENRHERARRALDFEAAKLPDRKKCLLSKLSKPLSEVFPGPDNNYLDLINRLQDFWKRSHNAIVICDQERIPKVSSFILSMQSDGCRPFLIVTASTTVYSWDAEFFHLAPTIDVVLYNGSKDVRGSIRNLEFYAEGGGIKFQVLISPVEAILEDMDVLKEIVWEAIVLDECQQSRMTEFFKRFNELKTEMRLLVFHGQLKETASMYHTLLSLLQSNDDSGNLDGWVCSTSDNMNKLKEQLSRYTVFGCKTDSSRFVEYWVPVQISNVQLEQYCSALIENSLLLRSSANFKCCKTDTVGVLRDILINTRKCCDHPYIVDPSIQPFLIKDHPLVEYLDVGIKASGKLLLLDKLLMELKKQGLRVLILFQSIGSLKDSPGDILDDYLRQRFGEDSYERVDGGGIIPSKKQAALNRFNDKALGRFVFLLEKSACLPSVKLSSVDVVVIFGSDWNPANDIRNLQKVTMESQFQRIKVFRLYLSCTVEEKVLIGAKQGMTLLDSKLQGLGQQTCHVLLMWGAAYLMNKLDEFHSSSSASSIISSDQSLTDSVVQEFLTLLPQNDEDCVKKSSLIVKVWQKLGRYCTESPLIGELKIQSVAGELPHAFWTKLLDGKQPNWKYLSSSTNPRNRKRVQLDDSLPEKPEPARNEQEKKHKKSTNINTNLSSRKPGAEGKKIAGNKEGTSRFLSASPVGRDSPAFCQDKMFNSNEGSKLREAQRSLHPRLKSDISGLCDLLNLSDNLKLMVEKFLDYVINNSNVNSKSPTILQALQLALCWTAASLLKIKIDHKESLELAKLHLNYECNKEEADYVYSMLRDLKKMFLQHKGNLEMDSWKCAEVSNTVVEMDRPNGKLSETTMPCLQNVKIEADDCAIQGTSSNEVISSPKVMDEFGITLGNVCGSGSECQNQKHMERLLQEQVGEMKEICRKYVEEKAQLEDSYKAEAAMIRLLNVGSTAMDKLKILDKDYSRRLRACENKMNMRLRALGVAHLVSNGGVQLDSSLFEGDRRSVHGESPNKLPEPRQNQDFPHAYNHMENFSLSDQSTDAVTHRFADCNVEISDAPEVVPDDEATAFEGNGERASALVGIDVENDKLSGLALGVSTGVEPSVGNGNQNSNQETAISSSPPDENHPDGATATVADEEVLPETTSCVLKGSIPINPLETTTPLRTESSLSDREVPAVVNTDATLVTADAPENPDLVNARSSDVQNLGGSIEQVPGELAMIEAHDYIHLTHVLDNVNVSDPHLSAKEGRNGSVSGVLGNDHPSDGSDVVALVNQSLSGMPDGEDGAGPSDVVLDEAEILPTTTETGIGRHGALIHQDFDSQGLPLADSASMQPSNVFPEAASVSSYPALANQELRGDSNATCTSMPERNEVDEEQHDASRHTEALRQGLHDLPLVNETEQQPPREGETVNLIVQMPSTLAVGTNLRNQAGSESTVNMPGGGIVTHVSANLITPNVLEPSTQPFRSLLPLASTILPQLQPDPLQKELERIQRELDQTTKSHEDEKVRLRSDCEKEIEEIVAQIRRKYDLKLEEVEAEYLPKRRELESNRSIVIMNKILAEAFRSKCVDLKASGKQGGQRDVTSRFEQQLLLLAAQRSGSQPSQVPGPSTVLQTSSTPSAAAPALSSQTLSPTVASLQNVRTAASSVHDSSSLFSDVPSRPLQISHTMPLPASSIQVPSEVRGPAPHLQAFGPPIASLVPSHPIPNQQPAANSPLGPSYVPRVLPQVAPPVGPAGSHTGPHCGELTRGLAYPSDSWMGLFMDISCAANAGQVDNLAPGRDNLTLSDASANATATAAATAEVVCLSDDD